METPYRAVGFKKHEVMTQQAMDQLQANYQWINDNTPRGRLYNMNGSFQDTLMVVIAGKRLIRRSRKSDSAKVRVRFGRAFSPQCRPNVTTGINADFQREIFCTVHGLDGVNIPNSAGFEISVNVAADVKKKANDVIKKDFYVHWSAMGYRTDDMNEF